MHVMMYGSKSSLKCETCSLDDGGGGGLDILFRPREWVAGNYQFASGCMDHMWMQLKLSHCIFEI